MQYTYIVLPRFVNRSGDYDARLYMLSTLRNTAISDFYKF